VDGHVGWPLEGDVLVVETKNIKPESVVNGQPLSDEGVLIERFTLADANTLDYRMTINDPKVYAAPFTIRLPIPREESYGFYELRVPRGELRDEEPPQRFARRRQAARRGAGARREDSGVRRAGARRRAWPRRRSCRRRWPRSGRN